MTARALRPLLLCFLLVALSLTPTISAEGPIPETENRTALPSPPTVVSDEEPPEGQGLLYMTSLDIGGYGATFAVYDPAADTWTDLTPYETGCQMAVSADGLLYAHNYYSKTIDLYDPGTDSWTAVLEGPPDVIGAICNLEITNAGEFLYTEFASDTLWHVDDQRLPDRHPHLGHH